jgi:hypothetical protein
MMKKIFPLFLILAISSCGKIDNPKSSSLEEVRSFSVQSLTGNDLTTLQTICTALTSKYNFLNVTNNKTYSFGTSSKSCEDANVSATTLVQADIQGLLFKRLDTGANFIFPDVETNVSGVMKTVCANTTNPSSPLAQADGSAIWFTATSLSNSDCKPAANEVCLLIEKGVTSTSTTAPGSYEIVSKDWVKFQVDSRMSNYGFWTGRKLISSALCGTSKYSEAHADLK